MSRVALGIGCDRGTSLDTLATAVAQALDQVALSTDAVTAIATIDRKADEPAIAALARRHGWALQFYDAATLAGVDVPNPSETVRRYMGTPAVAEAAALLAAENTKAALLVEKHKYRGTDGKNATVAIARRRQA